MFLSCNELEGFMNLEVGLMNGNTWIYTQNRIETAGQEMEKA